jgi:hypothetical protein
MPNELIDDRDFAQLVTGICRHPDMYVVPANFGTVCSLLTGFDMARSGGPLLGLQPWLVMRRNDGNNLGWPGLVKLLLPEKPEGGGEWTEELRIEALGRLLGEFLAYRRTNGLTKLFRDYSTWLLRRSWYTGPLRQHKAEG